MLFESNSSNFSLRSEANSSNILITNQKDKFKVGSKDEWCHVFNLGNSIIGVSILALPYIYHECGYVLATLLLLLGASITKISCFLLVRSALASKRKTYEFLAFHTLGFKGKLFVEVSIIGFLFGICIAYFIIIGDIIPAIFSKWTGVYNDQNLRAYVLIFIALFVITPLGLLKHISSVTSLSHLCLAFYCLFLLKIFSEAVPSLLSMDWIYNLSIWNFSRSIKCIPIICLAFNCQTTLFTIFEAISDPSHKKLSSIYRGAINLCFFLYAFVGFFGCVAFDKPGHDIKGDVLLNFEDSFFTDVIHFGFALTVALSFPLTIFPCRNSIKTLIYNNPYSLLDSDSHQDSYRQTIHRVTTIMIVGFALTVSLCIKNIEHILGLNGSLMGTLISLILPAIMFLKAKAYQSPGEKIISKVFLTAGVFFMVYGSLYNIKSASTSTESLPHIPVPNSTLAPQISTFSSKPVITLSSSTEKANIGPSPSTNKTYNLTLQERNNNLTSQSPKSTINLINPNETTALNLSITRPLHIKSIPRTPSKVPGNNSLAKDMIKNQSKLVNELARDNSNKSNDLLMKEIKETQEKQIEILNKTKELLDKLEQRSEDIDNEPPPLSNINNAVEEKNVSA